MRAPSFGAAVLALPLDDAAFPITGFASRWKSRQKRRKGACEQCLASSKKTWDPRFAVGSVNSVSVGKRYVTTAPGFPSRAIGAVEWLERRTVWGIATGSTSKDTWATKPPQALEHLLGTGVKVRCLSCRLPGMLIHNPLHPVFVGR